MRKLLLALCGLWLLAIPASADHIAGVDLTYKCIQAPFDYEFTVTIYRDCAGIPITTYTSLIIESICADSSFVVSVPPDTWQGTEITPICDEEASNCSGGPWPGFQTYVFVFPVTLSAQCDDWRLYWTDCCRSVSISTIDQPQQADVWLEANIDNTAGDCNSSPQFTNEPIFLTCLGQEFCYNVGAVDADGDSLVYSLIDPLQFDTITVDWVAGYSADQPLTSSPSVYLDPVSGDLCMVPTQLEITVYSIRVDEYRDGAFVGASVRDVQLTVYDCDNTMPVMFGYNGFPVDSSNTDTIIQVGTNFNWSIEGDDDEYPDDQDVGIYWDESIPDMLWDPGDPTEPIVDISWTPDSSYLTGEPTCFLTWIEDTGCPYFNRFYHTWCITVVDTNTPPPPPPPVFDSLQVFATWSENVCSDTCTGFLDALVIGGAGPHTFSWSDASIVQLSGNTGVCGGEYIITVVDSLGNVAMDTATLRGPQLVGIDLPVVAAPSTVPANVQIEPVIEAPASSYLWLVNNAFVSADSVLNYTIEECGTYNVFVTAFNADGCSDSAATSITVDPAIWPGTLPNVFTPNSDGFNDVFLPGVPTLTGFLLEVYNRWGSRVHRSELPNAGWDGRDFSGLEMPAGIYFYVVTGSTLCDAASSTTHRGTVQLLRD